MHDVDQTTSVNNVKNRIVKTEGCFVFGITIVFLGKGKDLNLSLKTFTTRRTKQFKSTMIKDITIPLMITIR